MPPKRFKTGIKKKYWYASQQKSYRDDASSQSIPACSSGLESSDDAVSDLDLTCTEVVVQTIESGDIERAFNLDHSYSSPLDPERVLSVEEENPCLNVDKPNDICSSLSVGDLQSDLPTPFLSGVLYAPTKFENLKKEVAGVTCKPYVINQNSDKIQFVEFYNNDTKLSVKWTVTIGDDFRARIFVHRVHITLEKDIWIGLPNKFETVKDVLLLLTKLQSFSVCIGNTDEEFQDLIPIGGSLSDNKISGIMAYREGDFQASKGDLQYTSTIRSVNCEMLVQGSRCRSCSKYRDNLRKRKLRIEGKKSSPIPNFLTSTYKHKDMDRNTLLTKMKQQKSHIKALTMKINMLQRQIQQDKNKTGFMRNDNKSIGMKAVLYGNSLHKK